MEPKEKLLKIRMEIAKAEQDVLNALNHLRDFQQLLEQMEIEMLEETLKKKKEDEEKRRKGGEKK